MRILDDILLVAKGSHSLNITRFLIGRAEILMNQVILYIVGTAA